MTPEWVLHSLKAGALQRCVALSADATRHLPAPSAAQPASPSIAVCSDNGASAVPQSAEERRKLVAELESGAAAAHRLAPASMLLDVSWSVADPPATAHLPCMPPPARADDSWRWV